MAFGSIMKFTTDNRLSIEMAPFTREEVIATFVPGFAQMSVTKYLGNASVQTAETESEWYDAMIKDTSRVVWGIWVIENDSRTLIGSTSLMDIELEPLKQATTGITIVDKNYWGKGIAGTCHRARTWYAFEQMAIVRLKSAVYEGNEASRRAIEKVGYTSVYTERNDIFFDGKLHHKECFECLNPTSWAWNRWWRDDRPTRKSVEARELTREVLKWADANVVLA